MEEGGQIHVISSELFWDWIVRWRRLLIIIATAILFLFLYISQTLIIITASSPSGSGAIELRAISKNGIKSGVYKIGSLALVARDTERIEATKDNLQTTVDITPLPWIGIKEIKVAVERDHNVDKISADSLGCTVFDASSNITASYSCNNPSGLYVYRTSDKNDVEWKNEALLTFPQAYSVVDFKNGLLGISNSATPQLFYADISTKSIALPLLPQGLNANRLANISIVGDVASQSNHYLLVDREAAVIYFADATTNTISYRRFTINKDWLVGASVGCTLYEEKAYCYIGGSTASPDSHDETEEHHKRSDGHIITIDFSKDTVTYQQSTVPKDEPIDQLYIDGNQQLYAVAKSTLYRLDTTKTLTRRTIVTPTVDSVGSGKTLYYIADGKLYELDSKTKQTFMRFSSPQLRISTITQTDSRLFINAHAKNAPPGSKLHTYQLLADQNTTPEERLVDKLNLYPGDDFPGIVSLDYYKNTIHIVIPNYVEYDTGGKLVQSNAGADAAKQEAINYLTTIIPNIRDYTITFSRATQT